VIIENNAQVIFRVNLSEITFNLLTNVGRVSLKVFFTIAPKFVGCFPLVFNRLEKVFVQLELRTQLVVICGFPSQLIQNPINSVIINFDVFLTLGDWDFKTMLPDQCRLSGLTLPPRFRQWVNVKRSFQTCQGYFPRSMRSMLDDLNIPLVGRHHSGIDDVNNIVSIVQTLALSEKGCVYDVTGRLKDNPS